MLGLKSLQTATKMIAGLEAMHMIKKGQTLQGEKSVQKQIYLIYEIFGLTAYSSIPLEIFCSVFVNPRFLHQNRKKT